MKILIGLAVFVTLFHGSLFAGDAKQETVYYDASGHIAGRCVKHGERTVCFDGSGRISTKAITRNGKTVYFDGAGRIIGKSTTR